MLNLLNVLQQSIKKSLSDRLSFTGLHSQQIVKINRLMAITKKKGIKPFPLKSIPKNVVARQLQVVF